MCSGRSNPVGIVLLVVSIAAAISAVGDAHQAGSKSPEPIDPVDAIVAAFERQSLVALAEAHGLEEEHDLIVRLVRDPRFANAASAVVVEWANALYQPVIDRYIGGEDVPLRDLRQAWRNTGFSPFAPWDAPVYERFFTVVREVNLARPPERRLRVVAADPPVDWTQSAEAIAATKARHPRDQHFHQVIECEVLSQNRKALLVFGGGHLYRHWWNPFSDNRQPQNLIDFLELRAPGSVFVIMVHAFVERHAPLEQRLAAWPKPGLVRLPDTWLGETSTEPLMQTSVERGFSDGTVARAKVNPYLGLKLQDLADAYLYLGDMDALTASVPSPELFANDPDYVKELQRRFGIVNRGGTLPESFFTRVRSRKFYQEGGR